MAGKKTLKLRTRDVGQIAVVCNNTGTITGPRRFVVSLNSDFDSKQSAEDKDRNQSSLHAAEDNLRVIQFSSGGTVKKVQIEQPINPATNNSVENKKYGSWRSKSPSQRFRFGQKLNLPITLHVEGKNTSKNKDDIVYRFVFFDKDDMGVCEGGASGNRREGDWKAEGRGRCQKPSKIQENAHFRARQDGSHIVDPMCPLRLPGRIPGGRLHQQRSSTRLLPQVAHSHPMLSAINRCSS